MRSVATELTAQREFTLPLAALEPMFWWFVNDTLDVRALQLMLVSVNVATFSVLAGLICRSTNLGALTGVGTLLAMEFRKPHDAVLGHSQAMPLAIELVLLSLLAYRRTNGGSATKWFIISAVLQGVACSVHEIALVLALAFPVIDVCERRALLRGVLIAGSCLTILALLGRYGHCTPDCGTIALNPHAALVQIIAAIPTTYRALGNVVRDGIPAYGNDTRFQSIPAIDLLGTITVSLLTIFSFVWARAIGGERRRSVLALAIMGVAWMIAPTLVRARGQWTFGMPAGEAYTTVYAGYFGFGLVFASTLALAMSGRRRSPQRGFVAVLSSLLIMIVAYGNVRVNEKVINFETVRLLSLADRFGVLTSIPANSYVSFDGPPPLPLDRTDSIKDFRVFFPSSRNHNYRFVTPRILKRWRSRKSFWTIRREYNGIAAGGLTFAEGRRYPTDTLYSRSILFRPYDTRREADEEAKRFLHPIAGVAAKQLPSDARFLQEEIIRTCAPTALARIYSPDVPTLSYSEGFIAPSIYKRWLFWATNYLPASDSPEQDWRYAEQTAIIRVNRQGCVSKKLAFSTFIFSAAPGRVVIKAPGFRHTYDVTAAGLPINISIPPSAPRRFAISLMSSTPIAREDLGFPYVKAASRQYARLVVATARIAAEVSNK